MNCSKDFSACHNGAKTFFLLNKREDFQAKLKPSFSVIKDDMAKDRAGVGASVNSVVEFPGEGLGRLITINSELNGAI